METPVSALSGGNQQKVLFARSLLAKPTVLLADEPTRGVDANARLELYQVLRRAAQAGQAVIVVSSDVVELQGLCDRVIVFSRGQAVRTLEGDDITEENITGAAITVGHAALGCGARGGRKRLQWRRFGSGDYLPTAVLLVLIAGLTLYTSASNDRFLTRVQLRQHAAARERARLHRARPADRHADRRHRPLGRAARRPRRRDHVLLRGGGSERRQARSSACWW